MISSPELSRAATMYTYAKGVLHLICRQKTWPGHGEYLYSMALLMVPLTALRNIPMVSGSSFK